MEAPKILLVDDHRLFMEGLELLLKEQDEWEIKALVSSGKEALKFLQIEPVDLVLLDYQMPEMDGIETLKAIRRLHPGTKTMLLSMHKSAPLIRELMAAGGEGFVLKTADKSEFVQAIRKVLSGGKYFSGELMEELVKKPEMAVGESSLTEREKEIIREICQGLSTQEIADKLFISYRTVETHRKNLMDKLEMKNIASLVRWALERDLG